MRVLVDTNILLRSAQANHPKSSQAAHAVSRLIRQRDTVLFCGCQFVVTQRGGKTQHPAGDALCYFKQSFVCQNGSVFCAIESVADTFDLARFRKIP
jgi:hypothetical protein